MAGINGLSSVSPTSSIKTLVERFIQAEQSPVLQRESTRESLNTRLKALNELKTKLTTLRDTVQSFTTVGTENQLGAKSAISSNETVFTAEATTSATIGVNTLFVSQLARNDIVASDRIDAESSSIAESIGEDTRTFTLTVGSESPVTISLDITDESETNELLLERLKDEINNSSASVSANVIHDTSETVRLTIVSDESGSSNAIALEDEESSGALAKTLGLVNGSGGRQQLSGTHGGYVLRDTDDLNAQFTLNGIEITSDTNTVDEVLTGITIRIRKTQDDDDTPETLTVTQEEENIREALQTFIDDYNSAISFLNDKTSVDTTTFERGPLASDFTFTNLKISMRTIVSGSVSTVESGNPAILQDIGVSINRDGTLALADEDAFTDALDQGATAITDLFDSSLGIAVRLESLLDSFVNTGKVIDDVRSATSERVDTISKSNKAIEKRLEIRERVLTQQFTQLQRALSNLNSQEALLNRVSRFNSVLGNPGYGLGLQ